MLLVSVLFSSFKSSPIIHCIRSCSPFFLLFLRVFISLALVVVMNASSISAPAASSLSRDRSPCFAMEYISRYGWSLDGGRFGARRVAGDQRSIHDRCFKKYRDKAVGAWIKR